MVDNQKKYRRLAATIPLYKCGGFIKEAIEEQLINETSNMTFEIIKAECGIDEMYFEVAQEVEKVHKKMASYVESYCEIFGKKSSPQKPSKRESLLDMEELFGENDDDSEDYLYQEHKDEAELFLEWLCKKTANLAYKDKTSGHKHFWSKWNLADSEIKCANEINPVEERILYYYYGLDGKGRRSFLQIARMPEFETKPEYIRSIYAAGEKGYRYTVRKFEKVIEQYIAKQDGKYL